jgi:hypothetical protein
MADFSVSAYLDTLSMGPNVVDNIHHELLKHFPYLYTKIRNEPFFTHEILCRDADGTLQAHIRYGWSDKTEKWVFECLDEKNPKYI